MKPDKEYVLDKLRRALEMEENMAAVLLDITQPEIFSRDIPAEKRDEIMKIFLTIKKDTARHKQIVLSAVKTIDGRKYER